MKNLKVIGVLLVLFVSACGGGSGGGGSSDTPVSVEILSLEVRGLKALDDNFEKLNVEEVWSNQSLEIETSGTYEIPANLDELNKYKLEIITQPSYQTCYVDNGEGGVEQALRGVLIVCSLRNEIIVKGLGEAREEGDDLVVTNDPEKPTKEEEVSLPYTILSIAENSQSYNADTGTAAIYHTFSAQKPEGAGSDYQQVVSIVKVPKHHTCEVQAGIYGHHEISCESVEEKDGSYDLAQGCYSVKVSDEDLYLAKVSDEAYQFKNIPEENAERFFFKPSGLGNFLLYDRDGGFLSSDGEAAIRASTVSVAAEWSINDLELSDSEGDSVMTWTFKDHTGLRVYLDGDVPRLSKDAEVMGEHGELIEFTANRNALALIARPEKECLSYPEAKLNATRSANFDVSKDVSAPVVGYSDLHAHLAFPRSIGGLAMSGNLFHRWGIEHALKDCDSLHGSNGSDDMLEAAFSGGNHDVSGYPDFTYWPNRNTVTHVTTYYKWLERAYLSGLKLIVTDATGNSSFCELLEQQNPGKKQVSCNGIAAVNAQTDYIYQLQDYIDAQSGGPGKGWFRIVLSPAEARAVIADNKLAVVLGSEHGVLFNCREGRCSEAAVETMLGQLHDKGVRSIFPIHRFDNAFGGTMPSGGVNGAWMNLSSKFSTASVEYLIDLADPLEYLFKPMGGHYWDLETCPAGVSGASDMYHMSTFVQNNLLGAAGLPSIVGNVIVNKLDPFPNYVPFQGDGNACNKRGLTDLGRYLIERMINKGMIIEIDHMSYYGMLEALDILEARNYSGFVTSHGWFQDSAEIRARIFALGGQISVMNTTPSNMANRVDFYRDEMKNYNFTVGIGLGSDIQGVTSQSGADAAASITYPFNSVDGLVTFDEPKTGNRVFDYEANGMEHFGLMPEWIDTLKRVDDARSEKMFDTFMNSAEAYLQMWERAEARAAEMLNGG